MCTLIKPLKRLYKLFFTSVGLAKTKQSLWVPSVGEVDTPELPLRILEPLLLQCRNSLPEALQFCLTQSRLDEFILSPRLRRSKSQSQRKEPHV